MENFPSSNAKRTILLPILTQFWDIIIAQEELVTKSMQILLENITCKTISRSIEIEAVQCNLSILNLMADSFPSIG
jgi:hypothetical protein